MRKGKAVIFSAPSGAGKTTIVQHLVRKFPDLRFSISATTRAPRQEVERDGVDYFFLTQEEFYRKRERNELYEWQEVYPGMFYGTLKEEVERIWAAGHHVIFDVDVIGGINLKKALGDQALSIFVSVSSVDVLRKRLAKRNTESKESLEKRVSKAAEEMGTAGQFDYTLINDDLDKALKEAEQIVGNFITKP